MYLFLFQLMNENLSKDDLNDFNDEFVDKNRDKKSKRRLRHKKSKLSIDDVVADERQRRKSRRQETKSEKKSKRPNIVLIMTDDQVRKVRFNKLDQCSDDAFTCAI